VFVKGRERTRVLAAGGFRVTIWLGRCEERHDSRPESDVLAGAPRGAKMWLWRMLRSGRKYQASRKALLFLLKTVRREFQRTAVLRDGAHDIFRCPRLNLRLNFERDFDG
jgi:hypothetical protein